MNVRQAYETYAKKIGDRKTLYKAVVEKYSVTNALYPGCHIDIAPSLVIPSVIYVDSFKGTKEFFDSIDAVKSYVDKNKNYSGEAILSYIHADYTKLALEGTFDFVISQYAGFVGQAVKRYLKSGGILLCNDSHGDATLSYLDDEFEFIGVVDSDNHIMCENLDTYFKFARSRPIDLGKVLKTMKGPKYKLRPTNYLFRKL